MTSTASSCLVQFRCTVSHLLIWLASLLWRAGARVLPDTHPARAFALGASGEVTRQATAYTPEGERVYKRLVIAWTGASLGWSALLVSELLNVTSVLWEGHLPGV